MSKLHTRLGELERKLRPSAFHTVTCWGEQTEAHAISDYGQHRIGGDDDLIVVIHKPGRPECN